jgi:hypothetical protein
MIQKLLLSVLAVLAALAALAIWAQSLGARVRVASM